MNAVKRRKAMAQIIEEQGGADVGFLARHFNVSPMTIRRDRKLLAENNMVTATHGGLVPPTPLYHDIPYSVKSVANIAAKRDIAYAAAQLVADDTCIILDAGTTTLELAKQLSGKKLSVITPDLTIALLLCHSPTVQVYVPGGKVDATTQSVFDHSALRYITQCNPSFAFIGTNVWDLDKGVTCSSVEKQGIKRVMAQCAEKAVLLADASKYGKYSPWSVAALNDFSSIITDSSLPATVCKELEHRGIHLLAAQPEVTA